MKSFVFLFLFSIAVGGCEDLTGPEMITVESLDLQLKEIQKLANQGNCSQAGDCAFLPIGSKACGGPRGFIVFSTDINVEELKKKVDKYTRDQKTYNEQNKIMSDCSLALPPQELACNDGNCVEIR